MPYVPNAEDLTQPQTDKFVVSAAAEFRTIKARLAVIAGGIGGTPIASALGGTTIANFVMNSTTPNGRVEFPDTIPAGWNLAPSTCYLQFEFTSTGFFAANPNAHFAIVTRADTAVIATAVRGMGAAVGNLTGAQEGTQVNPGAQAESWANGLAPATNRYLFPNASSPTDKKMLDGVRYRIQLESINSNSGIRLIRLAVYRANVARAAFDIEFDTGYVSDDNVYSDLTKSGLVFGYVSASNLSAWSVAFDSIRVVWGPPPAQDSASIDRLSRYGDAMEGDLEFKGVKRKLKLYTYGAKSDWAAFQSNVPNTDTYVLAMPNGIAPTTAKFLATNRDDLTGSFGYVDFGMESNSAAINTFGVGGHLQPDFSVKINAITTITFKNNAGTGEAWLPSSTLALNATTVNVASHKITGPFNLGGVNAVNMASSTNPLDFESLSTDGVIRTFMSPTPTNAQVEVVVRPLFGILSELLSELKKKKII